MSGPFFQVGDRVKLVPDATVMLPNYLTITPENAGEVAEVFPETPDVVRVGWDVQERAVYVLTECLEAAS